MVRWEALHAALYEAEGFIFQAVQVGAVDLQGLAVVIEQALIDSIVMTAVGDVVADGGQVILELSAGGQVDGTPVDEIVGRFAAAPHLLCEQRAVTIKLQDAPFAGEDGTDIGRKVMRLCTTVDAGVRFSLAGGAGLEDSVTMVTPIDRVDHRHTSEGGYGNLWKAVSGAYLQRPVFSRCAPIVAHIFVLPTFSGQIAPILTVLKRKDSLSLHPAL